MSENENEITKYPITKRKSLIINSKSKAILNKILNDNIQESIEEEDNNSFETSNEIDDKSNKEIIIENKIKKNKRYNKGRKSKNFEKKYKNNNKDNLVIKLNNEIAEDTDEMFSSLINNNKNINKCINNYDNPNNMIILNKEKLGKHKKKHLETVQENIPLDLIEEPNVYNFNIYYEGKLVTCSFNKNEKIYKLKEKIQEKISPFYNIEDFDILYKLKKIDFNINSKTKFEDIFDNELKQQNIILRKKRNISTDKLYLEKNLNNNIVIVENFPSFNDLSNELNTFFNKDNNYFSFQIQYNRNSCKIFLNNAEKAFSLVSYLNDLKFSNPIYKRLKINLDYKLTLKKKKKQKNIILPIIDLKNNINKEVNDNDNDINTIYSSNEESEDFLSLVNKNISNNQKNNKNSKSSNNLKLNNTEDNKDITENKINKHVSFRDYTDRNIKYRNYFDTSKYLFHNYQKSSENCKPIAITETSYLSYLMRNNNKSYIEKALNRNFMSHDKKDTNEDTKDNIKPGKKEFKRKFFLYPILNNSKKSPYLKEQKKVFSTENLQYKGKRNSYFFGLGKPV